MYDDVIGIMCSYNAVNGVPMCANALYLNDTLRNSWKFDGYVTSDCDAVGDVYTHEPRGHGYVHTQQQLCAPHPIRFLFCLFCLWFCVSLVCARAPVCACVCVCVCVWQLDVALYCPMYADVRLYW